MSCGHCVAAAGSSSDGNKAGSKSSSHHDSANKQPNNVPSSSGSLGEKLAASRAKMEQALGSSEQTAAPTGAGRVLLACALSLCLIDRCAVVRWNLSLCGENFVYGSCEKFGTFS